MPTQLSLIVYALVQRAVEDGIARGLRRSRTDHKDACDDGRLAAHVRVEVMQALDDVLDFGP